MKRALFVGVLVGCGGVEAGNAAPAEAPAEETKQETIVVKGVVERIELQNINKAQGHYTYNVEVLVRHEGIADAKFEADRAPGVMRIRVDKLYWDRLSEAKRQAIAPEGPKHALSVTTYEGFEVGKGVDVEVVTTSPGLAHPK